MTMVVVVLSSEMVGREGLVTCTRLTYYTTTNDGVVPSLANFLHQLHYKHSVPSCVYLMYPRIDKSQRVNEVEG